MSSHENNLDFEQIDKDLTEKEFVKMLELYTFFRRPQYRDKGFKSLNHVGRVFEQQLNVPTTTKKVLNDMFRWQLIKIRSDNLVDLDESAFEEFVETCSLGKKMFSYVDEVSSIRI
jgi:hypothetical protein